MMSFLEATVSGLLLVERKILIKATEREPVLNADSVTLQTLEMCEIEYIPFEYISMDLFTQEMCKKCVIKW